MSIYKLFGLPAHPLLVHLPVVGIPLLTLAVAAMVLRPQWRRSWALPLALVGVVLAIATVVAAGAGEKLAEHVRETATLEQHEELGEQLRTLMLVFAGTLVLYALLARRTASAALSRAALVVGVASLALGVVSTVWTVRAGHAGAKSVWSDVTERPQKNLDRERWERGRDSAGDRS